MGSAGNISKEREMQEFYKAVGCGSCIDGEEYETFFVVPMHVTMQQVTASEMGMSEDGFDCVCECFSWDTAQLIALLMNEHESMGALQ
jgi:hypothetical protein